MKMRKLFLIIGAPGSGKTTVSEKIVEAHPSISHYSTGGLLRAEVATGSELGKIIDSYISKGQVVPIDIAIQTITKAIEHSTNTTIIIDGYPRTTEQMNALDLYLSRHNGVSLERVIEIKVDVEVAKSRVQGRTRGADDDIEIFYRRMDIYHKPLPDIQSFYGAKNILTSVDGNRDLAKVVRDTSIYIVAP